MPTCKGGSLAMIDAAERARMLKAHSIGPRMISYLEEIGIERLSDLRGADADELAMRIDIALGRKHMNRLGVEALRNLIALAASIPH
jgi:nucleotidyltransferase/DNA polymerase involved in DNA repair